MNSLHMPHKNVWIIPIMITGVMVCLLVAIVFIIKKLPPYYYDRLYMFSVDRWLADAEQIRMVDFFQQSYDKKPSQLFEQLKKDFPVIKNISTRLLPSGVHEVEIKGFAPFARINDALVLSESGVFIPGAVYDQTIVMKLPHLYVHDAKPMMHASRALVSFLHHLSSEVYGNFDLFWFTPTMVLLKDKKRTDLVVMAESHTQVTRELRDHCATVYDIMKKNFKGKMTTLVADVRFEKQIIAYNKQGGGADGSYFF